MLGTQKKISMISKNSFNVNLYIINNYCKYYKKQ